MDPELNANEVVVKIENSEDNYTVPQPDALKEQLSVTKIKGKKSIV